jgi:toluene monooxygenase system ferredoxin subunit
MTQSTFGVPVVVCKVTDLQRGQMKSFEIGDQSIVIVWPDEGEPKAYDGMCPHQSLPLADGDFDGATLVCAYHMWSFDALTGDSICPSGNKLTPYSLRIEGEDVIIEHPPS